MEKRRLWPLAILAIAGVFLSGRVAKLASGTELAAAAQNQTRYTMTVAFTRGTVYDCNLVPLTNAYSAEKAVAIATPEAVTAIGTQFPAEERRQILERMQEGKPVLLDWNENAVPANGIRRFSVPIRYTEPAIAAHVIGYVNGSGNGVCGIEKAYDTVLREWGSRVKIAYSADALGRTLSGEGITVSKEGGDEKNGVVLTLDSRIQRIAEQAAGKMGTGAIVVLETATGKIRALVSTPSYDPNDPGAALNAEGSPLLNRALSAYNVGSVFKLVVACAAQKAGVEIGTVECTGTMEYAGRTFQCIGGGAHGQTDLQWAIACSCNCYFIRLAEQVGAERILNMAEQLGFGKSLTFAKGMSAETGKIPNGQDLSAGAALANFAFGQGDLLATPLQIASMVQSIANDGILVQPTLVEGVYSDKENVQHGEQEPVQRRVFSADTAETVRRAMIAAVENGTAKRGKPESGGAGAKTATAETGWQVNGETMIQAWCAGFYPAEIPQYVIAVLAENGRSGSGVCAPVFKQIADGIARLSEE